MGRPRRRETVSGKLSEITLKRNRLLRCLLRPHRSELRKLCSDKKRVLDTVSTLPATTELTAHLSTSVLKAGLTRAVAAPHVRKLMERYRLSEKM